ncbi:ankyrin repeat-containing domain protein [Cladorrhinum sp. PSN332]|nr:ankyrin repeat-containing domain protein [Cladorrhinum sp. PSN332]
MPSDSSKPRSQSGTPFQDYTSSHAASADFRSWILSSNVVLPTTGSRFQSRRSRQECPPTFCKDFIKAQWIVLTKAIDLEKFPDSEHQTFDSEDALPFVVEGKLGSGKYGEVDQVWSVTSHRVYARKRIPRGNQYFQLRQNMQDFEKELKTLRRLKHQHIVELVGSYTDPLYVVLLFSPVADCNLKDWLRFQSPMPASRAHLLCTFFGCLAAGLEYIHSTKVRHKDIKPENILVHGETVLYTDFGIALDWGAFGQSTTDVTAPRVTRTYSSPELLRDEPRNSLADVWSLGCVYLEMTTVLEGRTILDLRKFLKGFGSGSNVYATNIDGAFTWMSKLKNDPRAPLGDLPMEWIKHMLRSRPGARTTSGNLRKMIASASANQVFIGSCCNNPKEPSKIKVIPLKVVKPVAQPQTGSPNTNTATVTTATNTRNHPAVRNNAQILLKAQLFAAVLKGNAEQIRPLISRGVDVNVDDFAGQTSLHKAAELGLLEVVKALLESHANPNSRDNNGWSPLHLACCKKLPACTRVLLEAGAEVDAKTHNNGSTPLSLASAFGDIESAVLLLEAKADPNLVGAHDLSPISWAVKYGHHEAVEILLKHGVNVNDKNAGHWTLLMKAAYYNQPLCAKVLLERGADTTCKNRKYGRTALHVAAENGHHGVVKVLLSNGAQVDCLDSLSKVTPLLLTAQHGNLETVKTLVELGADVTACNESGSGALFLAAYGGKYDTAEFLINSGANVDARNDYGETPLHAAAKTGHRKAAKMLVRHGADVDAKTRHGATPLDLAISKGFEDIVELLISVEP